MNEEGDRNAFISRIGTFFLLVGLLVVVLFVASDMGEETYFGYFFFGIVLLSVGFILKRMSAPPASPGKRFEALRKLQQKRIEAKLKKEAAKKDPKRK